MERTSGGFEGISKGGPSDAMTAVGAMKGPAVDELGACQAVSNAPQVVAGAR